MVPNDVLFRASLALAPYLTLGTPTCLISLSTLVGFARALSLVRYNSHPSEEKNIPCELSLIISKLFIVIVLEATLKKSRPARRHKLWCHSRRAIARRHSQKTETRPDTVDPATAHESLAPGTDSSLTVPIPANLPQIWARAETWNHEGLITHLLAWNPE